MPSIGQSQIELASLHRANIGTTIRKQEDVYISGITYLRSLYVIAFEFLKRRLYP